MVWGAVRGQLPNVAMITLCRETDLDAIGDIHKAVAKSKSWAMTAPMSDLPFTWSPKQCNWEDEEGDEVCLNAGQKQVAIVSGEQSLWVGPTFQNGRFDVVAAVRHAFSCNHTVVFLGEYDCALSAGIMTAVKDDYQEA
eukprot:6309153-Pyramimonas_sp.AAC.1